MFNRKYALIISIIFLFIIIPNVSSAPPVTTVQQFAEGYSLVENPHKYLKLNEDYQYNFFVYNMSTGLLVDNSTLNCSFFLANNTGNLIFFTDANYIEDGYWQVEILGSNFSESGGYPYGVSCQDGRGGALAGILEVTESGVEITEARSILIIGLLGLLVFFLFLSLYCLFSVENYKSKFALYNLSHLLLIIVCFVSWQSGVESLIGGTALTGVFRILFWVSTISLFPMLILSIAWIFYIHTYNEHFQRLIDKGESSETAFRMAGKKSGGWLNGR